MSLELHRIDTDNLHAAPSERVEPLTQTEPDFLIDVLSVSEDDEVIMCVSELDGFLSAVVSGHNMIQPSQWLVELWGGSSLFDTNP